MSTINLSLHLRDTTEFEGQILDQEDGGPIRSVRFDNEFYVFLPNGQAEARAVARKILRALQAACGGSI